MTKKKGGGLSERTMAGFRATQSTIRTASERSRLIRLRAPEQRLQRVPPPRTRPLLWTGMGERDRWLLFEYKKGRSNGQACSSYGFWFTGPLFCCSLCSRAQPIYGAFACVDYNNLRNHP
jgi:hypothetical protein